MKIKEVFFIVDRESYNHDTKGYDVVIAKCDDSDMAQRVASSVIGKWHEVISSYEEV